MVVCTNLPVAGGNKLFVCCRKSNCQSVWLWAVGMVMVHGPRGPWLPRPAAHAVHRRSASAQRAPTQGPTRSKYPNKACPDRSGMPGHRSSTTSVTLVSVSAAPALGGSYKL